MNWDRVWCDDVDPEDFFHLAYDDSKKYENISSPLFRFKFVDAQTQFMSNPHKFLIRTQLRVYEIAYEKKAFWWKDNELDFLKSSNSSSLQSAKFQEMYQLHITVN